MSQMHVEQVLQQAFVALQKGHFAQADGMCLQVLQHMPGLGKALQLRAMIARKQGQFTGAEELARASVKALPQDPECTHLLANILSDQEKVLEATQWYEKSLKLKPDYTQAIQNFGYALLRGKDPLHAVDVFEVGLKCDPSNTILKQGLIYALKDSGQYQRVLDQHGKTLESLEYALTRGQILLDLGEFEAALDAFEMALDHPPTRALAFRNIAQIPLMMAGPDAAIEKIEAGLVAYADQAELYSIASQAFADMDRSEAASDIIERAEAQFGENAEIRLQKANLHILKGEGEEAYQASEAALRQCPGDMMIMGALVRAALMSGRYEIAREGIKAALSRAPENSYWLAMQATINRVMNQDYKQLYDFDKFIGVFDLAPPAGYASFEDFNTALKTALLDQHKFSHHPLSQSVRQGTQTHANLRYVDVPAIQDFFHAIDPAIRTYMSDIGCVEDHPFTRRNTGDYRIISAWSVRLQGAGHHVNHVHPEGWISSAYYVDVPNGTESRTDKAGWIKFGEPSFAVKGLEEKLGPERIIAPKPGRLVLFPSYMWHGTLPVKDDALRLTLPFDVVPA